MREQTIERMRSVLPATSLQAAERLSIRVPYASAILGKMVKQGYASKSGRDITASGRLIDVYHSTPKPFVKP